MIYLGGDSTICNGIMMLPDYGNPRQFYYLPPPPRLAVDPASGRRVFKLIKLKGGLTDPSGEGMFTGILLFDCDLGLTDDELAELEDHVRQEFRPGPGEISVAPLLYKDGEVACYILGEQDWPDDAPPERKNLFVQRLQGFGKPSLYGDNVASFSARLTQEGASVLEASLAAGGPIGISIVYTLKFDALRPAYKFKIEAKWEQIYHYLEEKNGVDVFFVNIESTNIVEELEQNHLLNFEEVVYDSSASGDIQQLRKQMQQYILEQFFTPVLSAGDPKYGKIPGMIADINRAFVVVPTFGYKRREMTQEERRSFSFESSRINAIERVIFPQANLFALIPESEIPGYTVEVNSDADLFFRQLDVQCVLGGCDFGKSKIAWVHPYIRYGNPPGEGTDKALTNMSEKMSFKTWLQPDHGFRYRWGYEVEFFSHDDNDPEAIYGHEQRLVSPEKVSALRVLPINPGELFDIRSVEFALKEGFPTDRYPIVMVHVKHEDSAGYTAEKTYKLLAGSRSCTFRARLPREVKGVTHYRIVYYPSNGVAIPTEWQVAGESSVVIDDPFPLNFTVRVHIAESPEGLSWADVSLRYEDSTHPGSYQEDRLFFEQDLKPQVWEVNAHNPTKRRYQFRFTLYYKDNTQIEAASWIDSDAPTLTLGRKIPMQRTVTVEPEGPSFDDEQIRDITVTLWPEETPGGTSAVELVFDGLVQSQEYTYKAVDPTRVGYRYELFYRWRNGRTKTVQWSSVAGALVLKVPTRLN